MLSLNVVGCGRVGQTLARLLHASGLCRVQDLKARHADSAAQAARFIGAGRAVAQLSDMRPADLWMLSVPDTQVAAVASELANVWPGPATPQRLPTAFHCSGFLQAAELAPLGRHGCQLASVHPVLNFASASTGVSQFAGTPCGIEGEATALDVVRPLMQAIGGRCFAVQGEHKALYHAAAVFSSNYLVVLQAIAREAWLAAGVPPDLLGDVHAALLQATVHNTLQLGPAAAITGPAARGDTEVVRLQQACVHDWHPEAADIYQQMAVLARRLALSGQTTPEPPHPTTPSLIRFEARNDMNSPAHPSPALAAAHVIWQHWQDGQSFDHLPAACRPQTRAQGYAAQACLPQASGRTVLGWKIAATSTAGQSHINVGGPLAGRILSGQVLPAGARVPPAGNRMKVAEPEMAFVFGHALAARAQPYEVAEVMAAVASLHPSIEIPNSRFAEFTAAGEAQLLADNACAHQFILGPQAPQGWQDLDLASHPVSARVTLADGSHWERQGSGAAVLGDPRLALTWLVNELSAQGIGLDKGQFVTTGTCMVPLELTEGSTVLADFGPLGQIGMQFSD